MSATQPKPWMIWVGRVLSAIPALMLLFSASLKFRMPPEFAKGMEHLGLPLNVVTPLGIVEVLCVILYVVPQTAVLGAILITGYMGGAMATHMRVGDPFLVQFGLGVVAWLGLYLREPRLHALLPIRKNP